MAFDDKATALRDFLARSFKGHSLADDEDMFALGFVNSLFAMQLVAFIEKEFDIEIANEDLDMDNFRSIRAILDLVGRKRAA